MDLTSIKLQLLEEHYLLCTINRPKALNALNKSVFNELEYIFSTYLAQHPEIYGVIITGAGDKAFVAGADITEFSTLSSDQASALSRRGQIIFQSIEDSSIPVIAAVEGFALGGGCELAMACHMRIASTQAKFGQPEVNLGLIPGYGGTQRLKLLVGKAKAMELLLTADMIDGETATALGLANHFVQAGETVETSLGILKKIAKKGPNAVSGCIECVNTPYGNEAYLKEAAMFGKGMVSDESKEGVSAFLEKRKANFRA